MNITRSFMLLALSCTLVSAPAPLLIPIGLVLLGAGATAIFNLATYFIITKIDAPTYAHSPYPTFPIDPPTTPISIISENLEYSAPVHKLNRTAAFIAMSEAQEAYEEEFEWLIRAIISYSGRISNEIDQTIAESSGAVYFHYRERGYPPVIALAHALDEYDSLSVSMKL